MEFPDVKHIKYSHYQTMYLGKVYNIRIGSEIFAVEDSYWFTNEPILHEEKDFTLPKRAQNIFIELVRDKLYKGCVYAIRNDAFTNELIKIGKTKGSVQDRCKQLFTTGVPSEFAPICCIYTDDYEKAEHDLHDILNDKRYKRNREYFIINKDEIKDIFRSYATEYNGIYKEFA